ncbi:MAG: hypothetical protein CMJ23_10135 [Phycisphaerae bacterium]|mgnify:CR=1 FL=1|nr:hypothetical protein [Phycisphaerae bacterium]
MTTELFIRALAATRGRRGFGGASVGLVLLALTGCISAPHSDPSPVGVQTASLLDADVEDGRFALYVRRQDGVWLFGGGSSAFAGDATEVMKFDQQDRQAVGDLMKQAGWFEDGHVPQAGPGPRYLEVSLTRTTARVRFTVRAEGRSFDTAVAALLDRLRTIADRRFAGVIDALPRANSTED